ncbi:50S ribosomal protein L18-like [Impatiens glandulifera]|uniref:50S ribosomal protein L18-like n=1 Tax=Impatiens glandulifera TaxID=253017 RepID=UPI001FB0D1D6|nr:50S ribosomal protein L18-like [Impatiens glandulifera]
MVIRSPMRVDKKMIQFLKPYVLKMHLTERFVNAQVIHLPSGTVASAASSEEKILRGNMGSTQDFAAAAKIGKILGERLLLKNILSVSVSSLRNDQKYQGKVKALIDSLKEAGILLV